MIMMMLRVVVVSIFAGIGQGLPDKVQCGQAIEVGSVLMAGLPAAAETEFDFATIKLSREGEAIECGGTYVPGERIDATLVAAAGTRWLFDLENGTFSGASASCGGRRSEGASTFVAPFSSSSSTSLRLRLRAGFASSYGVVTVTEDCVIYAAGATAPPTTATAAPTTAAPSTVAARRYETDVLVVGAGLAGVTAAWAARQADPDANVTILAASLSDVTTAYSGGWLWLPNNGLGGGGEEEEDPMEEFVAHVAGIAFPSSEEAPAWARENLAAFWEFSPRAMEDLREVVDWTLQHDLAGEAFPDYYGGESTSYPNNTMPRGRVVRATSKDDGTSPLSGAELLALIRDAADASLVLEGYLAVDVIQEPDGSTTVAARSTDKENQEVLVSAARGVVFATGGRIRRGDGEKSYGLDASVVGSCSSPDSTGAAMDAVAALDGVEIASKGNAWQYEVDSAGTAQWFLWYGQPGGDFIVVDGNGDRVYDESLSYNQRAEFHVTRRVVDGESVVEDNPAWSQLYLVYGDGAKTTYSGSIDAVDEVATNIDGAKTAVEAAPWFQGGTLSETFEDNLRASIEAFNAAASGDGIDPFGRGVPGTEGYDSSIAWWQFGLATAGKFPIQEIGYGGNPLTQPFANDPMMMMIYVRPLNYGAIDTKMGPRTDASQRVVGTHNVYAAGNAAASPFGQAYAAPGNTLGFALVSGYVAGTNAAAEYVLEWTGVPFEVRAGRRTLPKSSENQVLQLVVVVVQDDDSSSSIVVARSYGGHPWEGLMPRPLDVECDIVCSALVPEGTWLLGFEREEEEEEEAPAAAAAASRFLAQATFGPTTEAIDTFVDEYGSDPESWIRDQMTVVPASLHRDYFRERAYPLMTETCNGEAGTDETLGARYSWYYGTSFSSHSQLDVPYEPENGKGMVFANLALGARDQLRQRVAWALSHIYVVSVEDVPEARDEIEVWLEYYDIFVRHAFGNLRDVLRDVSFSPMMAHYLTYLGSAQYDGNDGFPDENYAREFMQLFTVGLRDLNRNGTFTGLETYASDDILTGARLWTGFDAPPLRSNVEALRPDNYIDDLAVYPERRDPFPKANLYGGYIGDRRPLCKYNNPLGAGAAFEYLGTTLSRSVSSSSTLVLDDEKYDGPLAALYAALCGEKIDGTCSFPEKKKTVMLSESLITPESFNATTVAIRDDDDGKIAAVYKYVPAPCVNMAFFDDAIQATDYQGRSICADPEAPFWHQELLVSPSIDRTCAVKVQVHKLGAVNIVHEPSSSWIRAWELSLDSDRLFRVPWANGDHPTAESGCDGCATRGVTCLCSTTVSVAAAFLDEIPSREEVLATLFIGSPVGDPSSNEEAYAHYGTVGGVAAYATKTTGVLDEDAIFVVENEVGTPIFLTNKVSTVHLDAGFSFRNAPHFVPFAVEAPSKHEVVAETEALIDHLFEHHNTAPFLAKLLIQRFVTSNPSPRYVEAVADAFRAGEYYGGGGGQTYYSGEYGDLGATIAAILLDREARSPAVLADPTYGRLREPLVKVLHFMRAMEFESTDGREVEFEGLAARIGQMVHEAPSVFSFYYPDYSPPGVVGDKMLVAPEAQVMTGTNLIGFANGLHSMIKYGLTRCNQGFGGGTGSCAWPADGGLMFAPTTDQALDIVDELDVLLTDGRLSNASKRTIANAIASETTPANGLKKAQELFVLTPEFHATNIHVPGRPRDETPPEAPSSAKFKAVVMLFLYGGEDSYTVLTPHSQCEYQNRLAGQYRDYRGPVADMPFDVTDDYLLVEPRPDTQPCEVFGMHPSLQNVHDMYQQGEASWFANIGPLVEPITVEELRAGTKRTPPSVGAHDVQQRIAQSVHSDNMNARGVMGRILNVLADPTGSSKLNAVGFSLDGSPKALEGSGAADIVDLNSLGFSRLVDYDKLKADIDALTDPVSQSIFAETYASLLGPAIANAEEIAHIFEDDQGLTAEFGDARLSQRFKDIARIINKREAFGYERAAFFVSIGGFDTHGTLERLPGMLTEIDDALGSFVEEMRAQGVFDDVAVATMSDFGRTLTWNGQGTDHGWGGHHLIVSGGLNGSQIHGHYPKTLGPDGDMNINSGRGVIIPTTPWESMWAPLAKFMGVVDEDMDYVIPNIRNFPDVLGLSDVFEVGPTRAPTLIPTPAPSVSPAPSSEPSPVPTSDPSPAPSPVPTISSLPTPVPTSLPTMAPTISRPPTTSQPSVSPHPTPHPTHSKAPTMAPVCAGVPGVREYDAGELHCVPIGDGQIVDVLAVSGGLRTCSRFDENSCPVGFDIWVPKSYQHAKAVIDAVDRKFTYVVGVYREENGCGGCTQWAMNSEAQATYEAEAKGNRGWKSIAGEPWFMRETTYNEPNGNYRGDCWLTTNWGGGWEDGIGFRMDDSGCNYCFTDYLCSTNRIDTGGPTGLPTSLPSSLPTISARPSSEPTTAKPSPVPIPAPSFSPSISPMPSSVPSPKPTIASVCRGQEGNFEYGEHTLHCLEVNDEIVNVLAITNGERTCKRTDANSCPDGFDVWVPRSYDHAKAVRDLFGGSPYTDLVGIYREEDGCGGCTRLAMNSQVQLAYEAESKENVGWKSVAGNPWFMRETTFNEPNGDYTADCWLTTRWGTGWEDDVGFLLNDANCYYCFTTYLCSTNAVDYAPTSAPTSSPEPTITPLPSTHPTVSLQPTTTMVGLLCAGNAWSVQTGAWAFDDTCTATQYRPYSVTIASLPPKVYNWTSHIDISVQITLYSGEMGILFRGTEFSGSDNVGHQYYAGLDARYQRVILGIIDDGWQTLALTYHPIVAHQPHLLRVTAVGCELRVAVDGVELISVSDCTYAYVSGSVGLRTWRGAGEYRFLQVSEIDAPTPLPTSYPTVRPTKAPTTSSPTAAPTTSVPTSGPTTSRPTTSRPTASPTHAPTLAPVCGSVPGVREYDGGELHCIPIGDGQIVDVLTVSGGLRTCSRFDSNSCPAGFDIWVPRSYEHAKAVIDAVDRKFTYAVGVYREESGCGGCTQWAMNSAAQAAYEAEAEGNLGWKSIAGEPWFMRETTYNEPNGNYRSDCWLTTNWGGGWQDDLGFRMDDSGCNYCFTDYLCSTNRIDDDGPTRLPTPGPTVHPTSSPTTSSPTTSPTNAPTLTPVCGGISGVWEYDAGELHCIPLGDNQIVNVLAVSGGLETCGRLDENSCPSGFDIWVPQSYEHAKAVVDAVDRRFTYLVGVYRDESGCGGCAQRAMNAEAQAAYEAEAEGNLGWTSVAGEPWFMRTTTYGEPNGDYSAGCWLTTNWGGGWQDNSGFNMNDWWCNYCFTDYLCSTNQIEFVAPTSIPTTVPTVPAPVPFPSSAPSSCDNMHWRAYFAFDDGLAVDSTGNDFDCVIHGATATTDRLGNPSSALYFDGESNVECPALAIGGADPRTYCAWARADESDGPWYMLFKSGDTSGVEDSCPKFELRFKDADGRFKFAASKGIDPVCNMLFRPSSQRVSNPSDWHFLCVGYDGVDVLIHADGSLLATYTPPQPLATGPDQDFVVGHFDYGVPRRTFFGWVGAIDNFMVFSKALSSTEIESLYTAFDDVSSFPVGPPCD